jgi:hypothetical protein
LCGFIHQRIGTLERFLEAISRYRIGKAILASLDLNLTHARALARRVLRPCLFSFAGRLRTTGGEIRGCVAIQAKNFSGLMYKRPPNLMMAPAFSEPL